MYSPKIRKDVVRVLYRMAKHRQMPMTELVHELLMEGLEQSELPEDARPLFEEMSRVAECPEGIRAYPKASSSTKDENDSR